MVDLHKGKQTATLNDTTPTTTIELADNVPLAIRRSRRDPRPTSRLKDSLEYLSQPQAFLTDTENWVPGSFSDAMRRPDLWWEPMVREYEMLKEREVFELTPQPLGRNIVGSKWVYAIKWKDDGTIDKRKARTVAKGFTQVLGEDYNETYASVARLESVRLVCAIAASRRLRL